MAEHIYYDGCETGDCGGGCWYCTLAICKACGLVEGSLTTDCPGEEVFLEKSDDIYNGKLDYKEGLGWVEELNPTNISWLYSDYVRFNGGDNKFIKHKNISPFEFKKIKKYWIENGLELSKI